MKKDKKAICFEEKAIIITSFLILAILSILLIRIINEEVAVSGTYKIEKVGEKYNIGITLEEDDVNNVVEIKEEDGKYVPKKQIIRGIKSFRPYTGKPEIQIQGAETPYFKFKVIGYDGQGITTQVLVVEELNIEKATITLAKYGKVNKIMQCRDLTVESENCPEWIPTDIPFTDNGDTITFEATHFSAYAGADIEILNIHSYPSLYGNWTVEFTTTGAADLKITATKDLNYSTETTRWHNIEEDGYDLKFLEIKCGNTSKQYEWIGSDCQNNECSVLIKNYSCSQTAAEISKVLTSKKHVLKFEFGNQTKYAYNDIIKSENTHVGYGLTSFTQPTYSVAWDTGHYSTYVPTNAFDGDFATYWQTDTNNACADSETMGVDLGQNYTLDWVSIMFYSTAYNFVDFKIEVSTDNITWTTAKTVTGASAQYQSYNFTPTKGRYLRINATSCDSWGIIYEIWVGGQGIKSIHASSSYSQTYNPWYAIDGTTANRFDFLDANDDWLLLDFGDNNTQFSGSNIDWYSAAYDADNYSIQISNDSVNWITVFSNPTDPNIDNYDYFGTQTARFYRIYAHDTGAQRGIIYDMDVYQDMKAKALMVWDDKTNTIGQYRLWNQTYRSTEGFTIDQTAASYPYIIEADASEEQGKKEAVFASHDIVNDIHVQVWNGSVWDNNFTFRIISYYGSGASVARSLDVEYFNNSHALVVWWDYEAVITADNSIAAYAVWDGNTWTEMNNTPDITGNEYPYQQELGCDPNSNECILVQNADTAFGTGPVFAMPWNGTGWEAENNATLADGTNDYSTTAVHGIDVEYFDNGNAMVVFASYKDQKVKYAIWNSTSKTWSNIGNVTNALGGYPYFVELAKNPNSNEMALIATDSANAVYVAIWNTTGWTNEKQVETAGLGNYYSIDIAYENSGDAVAIWLDDGVDKVEYTIWNSTNWTGQGYTAAAVRGISDYLASDPDSDEMILMSVEANHDIYTEIWNGTNWTNVLEIEPEDSHYYTRGFSAVYFREGPTADNPPTVSLISPADATSTINTTMMFNCSATDDNNLVNITLYHNISGTWQANNTQVITGTSNSSNWTIANIPAGNYIWNCLAYDSASQSSWNNTNWTLNIISTDIANCTNITLPGIYYLTENITNASTSKCLNIQTNNVTLDCNGNVITGNNTVDYGVYIYRNSITDTNITVKNCTITNWNTAGIYLYQANNNTLENLNLSSNPGNGILLNHSSSNTMINSHADDNSAGISFQFSSNSTIINFGINNNTNYGTYFYNSSGNNLTDSYVSDNGYDIFIHNSNENIFRNNIIMGVNNSFDYSGNLNISKVAASPQDPANYTNIGKYLNLSGTGWIYINISYNNSDIINVNESTLRIWKHNASWSNSSSIFQINNVDTANNIVYANITSFGSTFAPLGETYILTNLTIYHTPPLTGDCSDDITFCANFTNATGGNFISGAICNITFSDKLGVYGMTENATIHNYCYTRTTDWDSAGIYTYQINCSKINYEQQSKNNSITFTQCIAAGQVIPEFGLEGVILTIFIVIIGHIMISRKKNIKI